MPLIYLIQLNYITFIIPKIIHDFCGAPFS
jgi:hypothetical protein